MGTEPDKSESKFIKLLVDQYQVRLNVAITMVTLVIMMKALGTKQSVRNPDTDSWPIGIISYGPFVFGADMEMYCSNPACRWHKEQRGGRFIHMKPRDGRPAGPYCEDCVRNWYEGCPGKNLWDFTTSNISGDPIHVRSLQHLHQLEKQYGVQSVVANMDEKHWSQPGRGDL